MGWNHTVYPLINTSLSLKAVISIKEKIRNWYFHHLAMFFTFIKKIILKGHPFIYPFKQKDICDYNPICIMSSDLWRHNIFIFRSKVLECHVADVDSYLTSIENNQIYLYMGSLKYFYCKRGTHESLDFSCPYLNVEIIKIRKYLSNIYKCDTLSDDMKAKIDH